MSDQRFKGTPASPCTSWRCEGNDMVLWLSMNRRPIKDVKPMQSCETSREAFNRDNLQDAFSLAQKKW
jgi:hypothetical protein